MAKENLLPKIGSWKISNGTGTEVTDSIVVTEDGYGCSFTVTHESSYVYYQLTDPPFKGHTLKLVIGGFTVTSGEARVRIQMYDANRENYERVERYSHEIASFPFEMEFNVRADCGEIRFYVRPGNAASGINPPETISISGLAVYDTYTESYTALNFHKVLAENLPQAVTPGTEHVYYVTDGAAVSMYISNMEGQLIRVDGGGGAAAAEKYHNAYTQQWINERKDEIINLQKQGDCITFAVATDIHVRIEDGDAGRYNQVRDFLMITDQLPIDYICCCGDIMSYCQEWDGNVEPRIEKIKDIFNQVKVPWFATRGNHDYNSDDNSHESNPNIKQFTAETCDSLFVNARDWFRSIPSKIPYAANMQIVFDPTHPTFGYFYVDDYFHKHRMIFTNSEETHETELGRPYINADGVPDCFVSGIETEHQIDWLINKALDMSGKEDWVVSFYSHTVPYTDRDEADCSEFHGYGGDNPDLRKILKAFQDGTAVTLNYGLVDVANHQWKEIPVNMDFSMQGPIQVIGWFGGHVHNDCYKKVDGLNVCVSTCTCASQRKSWSADPTPTKPAPERDDTKNAMSVNIVIVNKTMRTVNVVKLGSKRDNAVRTSSDYFFTF